MITSPTESQSSSSGSSPIAQSPHPRAWFPRLPRRGARRVPKAPRYYSTPMDFDTPGSTPLHMYGLEQREPSIAERPKLLRRFSHALGDIKEDFSLQLDPRSTSDKIAAKRRSTIIIDEGMFDGLSPGSSSGSLGSGAESPMAISEPPRSRPMSVFQPIEEWTPPPTPPEPPMRGFSRRLTRRLTFSRKKRPSPPDRACISQPNLIGASTQI